MQFFSSDFHFNTKNDLFFGYRSGNVKTIVKKKHHFKNFKTIVLKEKRFPKWTLKTETIV